MQEQVVPNEAPRARALKTLRGWITQGSLAQGEPLPSERALSRQLDVHRDAVRWALQALQDENLIKNKGPRTRIVSHSIPESGNSLMSQALVIFAPVTIPVSSDYWDQTKTMWSEAIARGAMQSAGKAGLHILMLQRDLVDDNTLSQVVAGRPKAVLVPEMPKRLPIKKEFMQALAKHNIKLAVYGGQPELASFDRIVSDHESGSYDLTQWLIKNGRKRILCVWPAPADEYWYPQRYAGYERAMREAGLEPAPPVKVPLVDGLGSSEEGFAKASHVYAGYLVKHLVGGEPVDAIMASTDNEAFAISAACRLCGREPHEDVAVAGYDNYWSRSDRRRYEAGPCATVDKRNWDMGAELFGLLMDRMSGKLPDEPQRRAVKPKLVIPD